ncbi:MAG: hypothetical protein ACYCZL_01310 [Polaromonas sp.]
MKQFTVAFYFAAVAVIAGAQTTAPAAKSGLIDAERARISTERSRLEAGFLAEDAACYKRFAVNNCLGEVNVRRRQAMADLRRQEILLNDEERKSRGAEQIRKIEEQSSTEKQKEVLDRRAKALQDYQSRLDGAKEKSDQRAVIQSSEKANSEARAERLKGNQEKAQARADRQAVAAEEVRKFNERQMRAEERRAKHEADQLKRSKPAAKALPLPE